jgi:hypothetical protein
MLKSGNPAAQDNKAMRYAADNGAQKFFYQIDQINI